jgi:hypothetical protein
MTSIGDLSPELAAAVRRETAGETSLWLHQPAPKDVFRAHIAGLWFGIPWLTFCFLWELLVLDLFPLRAFGIERTNGCACPGKTDWSPELFMGAFGSLFVLIGVAMVWAPFGKARQARHSAYVVTDRHVRFVGTPAGFYCELSKVAIDRIQRIDVKHRGAGLGDLRLVTYSHTNGDGEVIETALELKTVADATALEALIRQQMPAPA